MIRLLLASIISPDAMKSLPQPKADSSNLTDVFNIVLGTMGAIAFFMVVLAGFRYVVSQGEPDKVAGARRTIVYSIVGLVVIALAAVIVNFVLGKV